MKRRANELDKSWFRSDRFFTVNDQWYFASRERENVGPFESITAARRGVSLFVDTVQNQNCTYEYAATIACDGNWAITYYQ